MTTKRKTPAEEAEELRQATREAHEALKDLRHTMKAMEEVKEELLRVSGEVFKERMEAEVQSSLADYAETIRTEVEKGTKAVENRFDVLARILLGKGQDFDIEELVMAKRLKGRAP